MGLPMENELQTLLILTNTVRKSYLKEKQKKNTILLSLLTTMYQKLVHKSI